jgi:hypothetical protein
MRRTVVLTFKVDERDQHVGIQQRNFYTACLLIDRYAVSFIPVAPHLGKRRCRFGLWLLSTGFKRGA